MISCGNSPFFQADDCINLGDERSGNFAVHDITSAANDDWMARKLVAGVVDDDLSRIRMIFLIIASEIALASPTTKWRLPKMGYPHIIQVIRPFQD